MTSILLHFSDQEKAIVFKKRLQKNDCFCEKDQICGICYKEKDYDFVGGKLQKRIK